MIPELLVPDQKRFVSEDATFLKGAPNFVNKCTQFELSSCTENRFFADSPYYDAFVEKEMHAAEVLCAAFNDIGTETISFCKVSEMLVKSLDSLSSLCRNCSTSGIQHDTNQTRVELGPEVVMLQALGKTLEEISAQHRMVFDVISTSLGYHLLELSMKQADLINKLKKEKKEAEIQTRHSEQEICRYLNGKSSAGGVPRSHSFTDESQNTGIIYDLSHRAKRRFSLDSSERRSPESRRSQRIRMEETTAELKRFQLIKNIVDANYERRLALSQSNEELLGTMQTCFQLCSEKVGSLIPLVKENQRKCSNYQSNKKPLWEERERLLIQTRTAMERGGKITLPHNHSNGNEELTEFESEEDDIWDLPYELAVLSKFQRPSPRDVLMEGWLYQKRSSMMSLQSSWVRRWFILKSRGIYYLESSPETLNKQSSTKFKVKLFDVALCTVRELPDDPNTCFCFQLINSNNNSITLQARGPKELQMWLDRIRSAVKTRLAKDNRQIFNERTCEEPPRWSSEIKSTVVERRFSLCWDRESFSTVRDEDEFSCYSDSDVERDLSEASDGGEGDPTLQLLKANPVCADCSALAPDWVSLNLGILLCLECSSVHRSLGCHVSKVRSLTLDRLSHAETTLLLSLGNERANRIWEKEMTRESKSLKEMACVQDRKAREDWIRSKYVTKKFIGHNSSRNMNGDIEAKWSRELYAASKRGDVVGVATALAHGAKVDWTNNNNDNEEDGATCTALKICLKQAINGVKGALACTELLLQNGAKADK